jgi:hypothetical protein
VSGIDKINSRGLWLQAIEVGVEGKMVQKVGYGTNEPATTSDFKPAEMAAERGGEEDGVRVLLKLFKRNGFLDGNLR